MVVAAGEGGEGGRLGLGVVVVARCGWRERAGPNCHCSL
jgi:hypothetical protein